MITQLSGQSYSLEELGGRTPAVVGDCQFHDGGAVGRVPAVVATGPWKLRPEAGHEVVDGPAYDGVVIHPHVDVQEADSVSHSCKEDHWGKVSVITGRIINYELRLFIKQMQSENLLNIDIGTFFVIIISIWETQVNCKITS